MPKKLSKKLQTPEPVLVKKRHIKTAIFYDPFGSMSLTTEEQIEKDVQHYHDDYGPFEGKVILDWYTVNHIGEITPNTELLLFDYGGMSYGNDLMEDNSRRVIQWALDNPNAVVMVTSEFTYNRSVERALTEQGLTELPNVLHGNNIYELPQWLQDGQAPPRAALERKETCQRCKKFMVHSDNWTLYDGQIFTCSKCFAHVCGCCFEPKKKTSKQYPGICGDCANW